jgi:hypothetical protein
MYGTHLDCERDQGETAAIELLKRTLQEGKSSLELMKDIAEYLQRKERKEKEKEE